MKLRVSRWYIALAIRVPGFPMPLCIGAGLDVYAERARRVAVDLAADLLNEASS